MEKNQEDHKDRAHQFEYLIRQNNERIFYLEEEMYLQKMQMKFVHKLQKEYYMDKLS